MEQIDKELLLASIKSRKKVLEQEVHKHTGYHKRHLTGQHSSLVDLEYEIEEGVYTIKEPIKEEGTE